MSYKDLFYFTGHCLALDEHPLASNGREFREQIIEFFADAKGGFNWASFIELCSDHLIIPAIYLQFEKHGLLPHLPEELVETLKEIYTLNRERNEQILRQIDDITAILNQHNIQPVFLKGTANLLDGIYSDVGERMIGDIDFLVKEEDYLKAAKLLEAQGYLNTSGKYFDVYRFKHYPTLVKEGMPASVEVHRMVFEKKYSGSLNSALIFPEKVKVNGKEGLFVPSDMHKLIHTFIHSQLADKGHKYRIADFRALNDLYRLSKRRKVSTLVSQTDYPHEACCWLATGQRLMGLSGLCPNESRRVRRYCRELDWSLRHVKLYNSYTFLKKLVHTVFMRYGLGLAQLFYSKEQRISVYRRLKDPEWYQIHATSVKEEF